uniref:Uncharacterized protein n=1 Tax=Megaselia scalaris TaxID=36166 RepID=T1GA83_MEGSC
MWSDMIFGLLVNSNSLQRLRFLSRIPFQSF